MINEFICFCKGKHSDLLPFKGVGGFFVIAEVKLQIITNYKLITNFSR